MQGRAIQLANFSEDEIVVKPKLVYNFASKQFKSAALSSPNTRVVKLIDPKFSISGISAVFVAPKYRIIDQSTTYELFSFKRRVGDILADGGVELAKEDKVNPPAESLAPSEENLIKITRVSIAQIEEFEPVPYPQKKIDDPDLNQGTQKVTKAGKIGKKKLLYLVRRENGVEKSRNLVSQEIVEKPQEEILSVGTKPVITVKCKFNDTVIAASLKYSVDANSLCTLMIKESNGNPNSVNPDGYYGLFQYELGFWASASKKAGYQDANWSDATTQIYTTAWAFANGLRGRWP